MMCDKESTAKVINLAEVVKPPVVQEPPKFARPTFVSLPVNPQGDLSQQQQQQPNLASVIGGGLSTVQVPVVSQTNVDTTQQQPMTEQVRNQQGQFNFPIQQQPAPMPAPAAPVATGPFCDKIVIGNSKLDVVNGVYTRMTVLPAGEVAPIYKRMDDIRKQGIITQVGDSWCVSFSFSLANFATITPSKVAQQCGAKLGVLFADERCHRW